MCGRYTLRVSPKQLAEIFEALRELESTFRPNYNVAPTHMMPIVRLHEDGKRHLELLRWGLIPFWAKDVKIGYSLINARADSVASKPSFRAAFKKRRCLVPADGFYEWTPAPKGEKKQPSHITVDKGEPFAFAGLWEGWTNPADSTELETFSIITTDANALMAKIHNRMPVILPREKYDDWLSPESTPETLQSLLAQYPAKKMKAQTVSTLVNSVKNNVPECLEPMKA